MGRSSDVPLQSTWDRVLSSNYLLAIILILAAFLRVAHIIALMKLPVFDVPILDSWMYDEWAKRIASGHWLGGERAFYMDPLYPYFLALVYRLFGRNLLLVRLLQAGLGVGTCALVALIGRRVAGKTVGNLAALLMAVCRPAIFQEGELEKTALGIFLVTAGLVLTLRTNLRSKFAAGMMTGLAALTRGNLLIFGPLGAVYLFFDGAIFDRKPIRESSHCSNTQRLVKSNWLNAVLFLFGFLLIIAPVTWRNYLVSGDWVITTSAAGANFYTGNNPANRSGGFEPIPFVRPHPAFEEDDFRVAAERAVGRHLSPSEISHYWFRQSWAHLKTRPKFALTVLARKTLLFWSDFELPDGWDMYFLARYSFVLRLLPLGMGFLLPFAILGAAARWKDPGAKLLVGYTLVYAASVIAFFVFSRYRVYVFPSLSVLAALGLLWIFAAIRNHDLQRVTVAALVLAIAGGISFFGLQLTHVKMADPAQGFMKLAAVYYEKGDAISAERVLGDALTEFPDSPAALCGMGRLQLAKGRWWSSQDLLTRCVRQNPHYPQAWFSLGEAYRAGGNLTEAARAYRKQIELVPGHAGAATALLAVEHEILSRSR